MASTIIPVPEDVEACGRSIVNTAYYVHSTLGAGLLESAYELCLAYELERRGTSVQRQLGLPISFHGLDIETAYRIDLLVDAKVIVEIKAVQEILPVHKAQLLTYLRLSKCRFGYLINFNVAAFKQGIQRFVA